MIKRKKKICKECGEERYIFSKGMCSFCAKTKYKPINKESKNRRPQNIQYLQQRKELIREWKEKGWYTCIFSGEPLGSQPHCHHWFGRDGEAYINKDGFALCKMKYHTGSMGWHNTEIKKLMEQEWWEGFKARLKERCPKAYDGVMLQIENRIDKS